MFKKALGLSLLFGFLTRLGALAAAAFLLSVMATQPPWVPGVEPTYFWYQLVEFTALLTLAAVGAGRWAGIDAIIRGIRSGCCRTTEKLHATLAPFRRESHPLAPRVSGKVPPEETKLIPGDRHDVTSAVKLVNSILIDDPRPLQELLRAFTNHDRLPSA